MATQYPQEVPSQDVDHAATSDGFGTGVVTWMHSVVCGLQGHDNLLQFARGRMFLKCVSCGHESPGWNVKERVETPAPARQEHRRRRFLPQLAGDRRVA